MHVFVSCDAACEETQLSERARKCFWVMMVNVCACGPGQQHFPAGRSRSSCWMMFSPSTEQLQSCDFKVEWDGSKPAHLPLAHKNREDSLSEERVRDLTEENKREKRDVNKEQPFLDVSKRGHNITPDFYLSEYLLNAMKKTRWDRCLIVRGKNVY